MRRRLLQPAEVLEVAKRANAVIYAVTAADAKRSDVLTQLAEATGGQVMPVKSSCTERSNASSRNSAAATCWLTPPRA